MQGRHAINEPTAKIMILEKTTSAHTHTHTSHFFKDINQVFNDELVVDLDQVLKHAFAS